MAIVQAAPLTTRAAETWAHLIAKVDPMPVSIAADFARDDGSEPAEACAAVEAVAQAHLDAHPADHRARRLLGEWLALHGDVRGEGLRALAACGRVPLRYRLSWLCQFDGDGISDGDRRHALATDWFDLISPSGWSRFDTRRAAEDAAAIAFARLPAERRGRLLKGEM